MKKKKTVLTALWKGTHLVLVLALGHLGTTAKVKLVAGGPPFTTKLTHLTHGTLVKVVAK